MGSRTFVDLERVRAYVRRLPPGTVVVSGHAIGVDQTAEDEARACGLAVDSWLPRWKKHGKKAAFMRNTAIARDCDRLVAFWDGKSRGTQHVVGEARRFGKPVEIYLDSK